MNGIKLSLMALYILIAATCAHAQERTDPAGVTLIKKSERITHATGWEKDFNDRWVHNENMISFDTTSLRAHCGQNFYWFQSASFNYKGGLYYVLFYEKESGEYGYPSISQDWRTYKMVTFMILTSKQYALVKSSIADKSGKQVSIRSDKLLSENEGSYDEKNFSGKLADDMNAKLDGGYGPCLSISSQIVKGEDIVRFTLPEDCMYSKDFPNRYFEIPKAEFKKMLID